MKKNMTNETHVEGLLYQHALEKKTSGENSKNPGTEYIAGTIDIATDDNKLTISYKDDGCGFDFEQIGKVKSNNTGYGIRMLVERVNLLRGSINYNKDEKEFVINIPLK